MCVQSLLDGGWSNISIRLLSELIGRSPLHETQPRAFSGQLGEQVNRDIRSATSRKFDRKKPSRGALEAHAEDLTPFHSPPDQ